MLLVALSAPVALMPVMTAAHDHSGHGGDKDGGGGSNSSGSFTSQGPGSGSTSGGGLASGGGSTGGGPGGSGGSGGNGQKSSGGFDSGSSGSGSGDRPNFGFGFNNDGASFSASIPISPAHGSSPASPHASGNHDHVTHPLLSIPLGGHGGHTGPSTHAMSYASSGGGLGGGSLGGNHELTSKLIHSVTSTLSDKFADKLGHSLHSAPATGSPANVVSDRFGGIGVNAFEPRVFTVPAPGETHFVANEIVVSTPSGMTGMELAAIARRNGLAPIEGAVVASEGMTLQRWRIADGRPIADVIRGLQGVAELQSAQPNFRFALAQQAGYTEAPADGFSVQYAPEKLHLPQAHRLSTGQGVTVAVIDTGIDRAHPEIAGAIAGNFDAIGANEPPDTHGTAIAGAIVAHNRLIGTAPSARLLSVRAFSTAGADAEATTMTIVRSVEWAAAQGARVINMSFAGARDPLIARAIAAARRKGIVLVAAVGNAGPQSPPLYPAADPNVIAVSATDVDDHLLDVANRGRQIALSAPGVDVLLPAPGNRYQIATGTSFGAAHVAGIVALMLARNPHLTPDQVRNLLVTTARDLGPKGRDDEFGAGLADAYKAVAAAASGPAQTVASNAPAVP